MCKIGAVLTLVPWYDFNKKVVKIRRLQKCYNLGISIITVVLSSIHTKHALSVYNGLFMNILQLISYSSKMVLVAVITLRAAFWHEIPWETLLRSFAYLEKCLKTEKIMERTLMKNSNFQALLINLLITANILFCSVVWISTNKNYCLDQIVLIAFDLFLYYAEFFKMLIVTNLALAIKCKYHDLHVLLREAYFKTGPDFINSLKIVSHLYSVTNGLINTYNRLFGLEIFLALLHSCLTELSCFCYIQIYYAKPSPEVKPISLIMLSSIVSIGAICLVSPLFLCFLLCNLVYLKIALFL